MSLDAMARLSYAASTGAWYHPTAPTRLATIPELFQREFYDLARFLRHKNEDESFNGLLLSESALANRCPERPASSRSAVKVAVMVGGRIRQTAGHWFAAQLADRVHLRCRHEGDPFPAASDLDLRNPPQKAARDP